MTARETFLDVGDSIMAAPGPGQYDPAIVAERVKGGSSLANRVSKLMLALLSFVFFHCRELPVFRPVYCTWFFFFFATLLHQLNTINIFVICVCCANEYGEKREPTQHEVSCEEIGC